ncbi:TetR/AcrR family transcriptional regulator [Nocardiopsis gilva YIM 90087]|uniref:TetR/AcrR family transcriptional regulator n=1 Tax=Nocardiopsis gilva YIM 90087 TaxID=1235441 RepID=A0A223S3M8_9ACTN|nr:TetR family transcriptional regulator [Nocardiopsis gilva]ASU82732.1 TetR/AcrR family transcriptional regulator [Nocardiopsis gilva YIM 90087]
MTSAREHATPDGANGSVGVRDRLLDSAYAVILAGRWGRLRMADIASRAGVSRQTLYNEFGSKEGLLQAVVVREAESFLDGVMAIFASHRSDPVQAVGEATRWTLVSSAENPLLRAIITGDDELLPVLTTRAEPLHVALGERMRAFMAESWPSLGDRGNDIVEVSLRLTLSYVLLPTDPDQAARRVELVVRSLLATTRETASS